VHGAILMRAGRRAGRDAPPLSMGEAAVEIDVRTENSRAVLVLSGRLTLENAALLRERIADLLRGGCREFVLDLERVPYIDSAGLGELVRAYTTVSRRGGTLKLLNLSRRVTELLSIAKLASWLEDRRPRTVINPPRRWLGPRGWDAATWFTLSLLLLCVLMIIWRLGALRGL
jgi:anti-sigma B factor antagonist